MNKELYHYGVKGMKWGVRRYQNKDGSLTDAGRRAYINYNTGQLTRKGKKRLGEVGENSAEGRHIRAERINADYEKNWYKSYNKAADVFDSKIKDINAKFGDKANINNKEYIKAVGKMWTEAYEKQLMKDFGPDPVNNGRDWVKNAPFFTQYDDILKSMK